MDPLAGERSALRAEKRHLHEELERQRLELRKSEIMEGSQLEGEGGKLGVWKGRLRRRGGTVGRECTSAGAKPVGRKEGKKEREISAVTVGEVTSSFSAHTIRKRSRIKKVQEQFGRGQLLPGIPDHITLDLITPKLSWADFLILPLISHAWKDAVYSREVYHARLQAHVRQRLHVWLWPAQYDCRYRTRRGRSRGVTGLSLAVSSSHFIPHEPGSLSYPSRLLQIPNLRKLGGLQSEFFYLDGKIYGIGRLTKRSVVAKIFVFDLGGKKQWIECASRQLPLNLRNLERSASSELLCSGKFVIAGDSCEYEIYDPELNCWSSSNDKSSLYLMRLCSWKLVLSCDDGVPVPQCEHGWNFNFSRKILWPRRNISGSIIEF